MTLRTELLFEPGSDSRYSLLGVLILTGAPRRLFRGPDADRLYAMQRDLFDLIALYQIAKRPESFPRRLLGRNLKSLDHALRRCAWLMPRMNASLSARAWTPDDDRAEKCPGCPWITGKLDEQSCQYPDCAGAEACR